MDESVHREEYKKPTYQSSVKLPKLDIPFFEGNRTEWTEWWNFFQVTVDQNRQLSDTEKLLYLHSRLIGDAKHAISGLRLTNENYRVAVALLKEKFNDTQLILHFHYIELINLPPANNSSKGLRSLYDHVEKHLRSLQALKQDIDHDIFIPIITSKIPKDVLFQLELQKGAKNRWSVRKLRELFNNYICATEKAEQQPYYSGKAVTETRLQLQMSADGPRQRQQIHHQFFLLCKYCKGNHWSDQCLVYPMAQDRKQKLKDSCFLCLRRGHIAYKCMSNKSCFYCQRRHHHHRSLCPKEFTENENAHFIDKETESVMEDSQTIKAKQRSETEASKTLNERLLAHEQENTTSEQSEGLQEPTDSFNSEVYNNKVKDLKAGADKPSEQGKICKVDNKFSREYAKLEFKCTKLNNKVLSMREELLKFKMENQDLQKQLKDISISITNTYISPNKLQLWHTKSTRSDKATKNVSQTAENDSDKSTKLHKEITLTKQRPRLSKEIEPFFDFKPNISSDHNLSAYLKRSFHKQLKTNVRGRFIPWLRECRGDPTNLISY